MFTRRSFLRLAGGGLPLAFGVRPALAETRLTVGLGGAVSSLDPHYTNVVSNLMVSLHLFDRLARQDEQQRLQPGLAVSWRALDDRTWEFKLRPDVRFSDGTPFGAEDVVASFHHVAWVPNSPGPLTTNTGSIAESRIVDPLTIRFVTRAPTPLLPNDLSGIPIINRRFAEAPTADFNSGAAAIGTGPYKLVSFTPGERIELVRNDGYWGGQEPWEKVSLRLLTNASTRVTSLLAGDVDLIDSVPTAQIARLRDDNRVGLFSVTSNRVINLMLDHAREPTPCPRQRASGQPLPRNPLRDVRVRQALSLAINRPALCERVMEGQAAPAGQVLPDGFFGTIPGLAPPSFDPVRARALLAEAGYRDGFRLTLHGPNDRYVNDSQVLQSVAQMWTRVGVETRVEALPWAVFIPQAARHEFSVWMIGWGSVTGEVSSALRALAHSFAPDRGYGSANRGRYANPGLDALIEQASATIDDERRRTLLQQAGRMVVDDVPFIPVHFELDLGRAQAAALRRPRRPVHPRDGHADVGPIAPHS